jgi:glycosyltransferase involved in cell wall biosynthesis
MKRMNIAVNCRLLQKGKLEGIGWFMFETLKRITADHPEHTFYFIFDRPFDKEFIFSENVIPVIAGSPARHPFQWLVWMEFTIPRVLKKINADVFFSPDGYLSLRTDKPSLAAIHDINFAHRPGDLPFWTRQYYNYFFPRYAKKAKRIITVSEYSKTDISKTYGIDLPLIHVVYNGANENFKPLRETAIQGIRNKYTGGKPYFLFIGSIHPRKNLENLIKGYARFAEGTGSEIKLLIVGAAMWKRSARLNDFVPEKIRGQVIFTGRLEASELGEVLASALALTFVPWFEGFGIPVLEAMYAGVPVLTSNQTSLPEIAGRAALYAHPGKINEIAEGMKRIAEDQELRKSLIEKGRRRRRKFNWDLTATKTWNALETVLRGVNMDNEI